MATLIPKIWYICTNDESRVVRVTSAGIILSDATVDPSLFDHATAKLVCDNMSGIMSHGGVPVALMCKPKPVAEVRA